MNREQFLDSLFSMYQRSFSDSNKQTWWNAYKKVLPECVDFDRLYDTLLIEYESKTAPAPAWLKKNAKFKKGTETSPISIETENIYADNEQGYTYCFSWIKGESSFGIEAENLIKMGLKNVRRSA